MKTLIAFLEVLTGLMMCAVMFAVGFIPILVIMLLEKMGGKGKRNDQS